MDNKKITPITRINKFFSEEDFGLEISMGREALEGDGNFTVILYRVDRENSASDNLYGEAPKDGIKYFSPVELKVVPILEEAENKTYNDNSLNYQQTPISQRILKSEISFFSFFIFFFETNTSS